MTERAIFANWPAFGGSRPTGGAGPDNQTTITSKAPGEFEGRQRNEPAWRMVDGDEDRRNEGERGKGERESGSRRRGGDTNEGCGLGQEGCGRKGERKDG